MPKSKTKKKSTAQEDTPLEIIQLPVSEIKITLRKPDHSCGEKYSYHESEIESDLKEYCLDEDSEAPELWGAVHAIENMVLAHAVAGVNVKSPEYIAGLEIAISACEKELF